MPEVKFHVGAKKTTVYDHAIIAIVIDFSRYLIVDRLGVSEKKFMKLIDEVNRKFFKNKKLNDYILADGKWLDARIERDVDSAIEDYISSQPDVTIDSPTFSEELDGETLLGGEMRLTAPYHDENEL